MKLLQTIGWIIHWAGQGILLSLFMTLASFWIMLLQPLIILMEVSVGPFEELSSLATIAVAAGYLFLGMIGLAIFTASLASMLKAFPLKPYQGCFKSATLSDLNSDSTPNSGTKDSAPVTVV